MAELSELAATVVGWYRRNGRDFPWRGTRDPYEVLVAEVLLQQTISTKVKRIYPEFLQRYPRVGDLADAAPEEVADLIEPLGLVGRAERLVAAATEVTERYAGEVPDSYDELRSLPGVGDYTACAVLCFAFGHGRALVDGVSGRVFRRVLGVSRTGYPGDDEELKETVATLTPPSAPVAFAHGVLDVAALWCRPKKPRCEECPLRPSCAYAQRREE